jgi:hypothetical protein
MMFRTCSGVSLWESEPFQVLPDESVGVLFESALPGMVGAGEVTLAPGVFPALFPAARWVWRSSPRPLSTSK